jgi:hypothetical protein
MRVLAVSDIVVSPLYPVVDRDAFGGSGKLVIYEWHYPWSCRAAG